LTGGYEMAFNPEYREVKWSQKGSKSLLHGKNSRFVGKYPNFVDKY
jgi:hypothetical protein